MTRAGNPDRRLAPRPLPAHLASAMLLWLSSRAALPLSKSGSPPSSALPARLAALMAEIDGFGRAPVATALDREIARRTASYLAGLDAYRRHPYRRPAARRRVLWRAGTTRLVDCGGAQAGPPVLVVPSLVNRWFILDLLPEASFLRHLAQGGVRPLVVDWGMPGPVERGFDLSDYVLRLEKALAAVAEITPQPVAVLGYCMGGLLALALALRRPQIRCLALLATPWDFDAERPEQARLLRLVTEQMSRFCPNGLSVDLIQFLFFSLDPFLGQRKFIRFAGLDPAGAEARRFVAVEDWLNDGVPLPLAVARSCARSWYRDNEPGQGRWRVAGQRVRPQLLRSPALVVLPARDRIVPPGSAAPLATQLPAATVLRPPLGHIGMMAAARAPEMLWTPIAEWLRARLDTR
jgi:polyhydroxyalkanoate synthase